MTTQFLLGYSVCRQRFFSEKYISLNLVTMKFDFPVRLPQASLSIVGWYLDKKYWLSQIINEMSGADPGGPRGPGPPDHQ